MVLTDSLIQSWGDGVILTALMSLAPTPQPWKETDTNNSMIKQQATCCAGETGKLHVARIHHHLHSLSCCLASLLLSGEAFLLAY